MALCTLPFIPTMGLECASCVGSMFQAGSKACFRQVPKCVVVRPLVKCKTASDRYPVKATEVMLEALSSIMRKPGTSQLYGNV